MAPLKPSATQRSRLVGGGVPGTAVGSAAKAAKRCGFAATTLCRRSFMRCVSSTAMSAGSFCVDGAPWEITCMPMPTSSISLMRSGPKS